MNDLLETDPDDLEDGQQPFTADPDVLLRFIETEALRWYDRRQTELANRPLIRDQAFGESLNADKPEVLARYEVHLDRKLERMLTMLVRLKALRSGAALLETGAALPAGPACFANSSATAKVETLAAFVSGIRGSAMFAVSLVAWLRRLFPRRPDRSGQPSSPDRPEVVVLGAEVSNAESKRRASEAEARRVNALFAPSRSPQSVERRDTSSPVEMPAPMFGEAKGSPSTTTPTCGRCGETGDVTIFSPRQLPPTGWPYLRREWPQASKPIPLCDRCRYGQSGIARPDGLAKSGWEKLLTSPKQIGSGQGSPRQRQ